MLIIKYSYLIGNMSSAKYLSNILLGQDSAMMSNVIHVICPVLSITVLMFSLRAIMVDIPNSKIEQ